jgi:tRNA(fMet)-specific endonuclease VapC
LSKLETIGEANVYVTVIVAGELRFGAAKKRSPRLAREVEAILSRMPPAPLQSSVEKVYAEIRADLERRGAQIGSNDLWIAAQALHDGSVLVTDNVKEFGRVPKLRIENWLRA